MASISVRLRALDPRKFGFLISLSALCGSLYFSEILKFQPCVLCWYQRIALYPLFVIYLIALATDDRAWRKYSLALIAIGAAVALYHNLLYYGVISHGIVPCTEGIPCTSKQLELFGFITIPLLSLAAFLAMAACELLFKNEGSKT